MSLSLGLQPQLGGRSQIQRAISLLRRFGSDAHLWLPGVGTLNGLTTGNYLESTGNTLATVDNPTGLVLDALGSVGVELAAVGSWNGATGDTVINSGASTFTTTNSTGYGSGCNVTDSLISGKTYTITFTVALAVVGSGITAMVGGVVRGSGITTSGTYTATVTATGTNKAVIFANGAGVTFTISAVSVREVSGIHLTQGTTADKGILKLTGGRYNWVFDSTDKLSATIPAGWESATTIDAKSTGQVTLQSQNIVGSYLIGPSLTTYGRIILKTAPTASELALLQSFANRLAGL